MGKVKMCVLREKCGMLEVWIREEGKVRIVWLEVKEWEESVKRKELWVNDVEVVEV